MHVYIQKSIECKRFVRTGSKHRKHNNECDHHVTEFAFSSEFELPCYINIK